MVWLFGGGRNNKNKKLKEEVEKIDKDIEKLLEEAKKNPFGKNEEYRKLIEKILEEIEEHKKSLHKLYGSKPNDFPELENVELYLREYYKILEAVITPHTVAIPYGWLESRWQAIEENWHRHKIKFL